MDKVSYLILLTTTIGISWYAWATDRMDTEAALAITIANALSAYFVVKIKELKWWR